MRLNKLILGSSKAGSKQQFRNLKNVTIDFDQEQWITVLIGWNGTGKSNVLEALAIIFRDLIDKKREPAFAFQLSYRIRVGTAARRIHIDADPDREKEKLIIHVASLSAPTHIPSIRQTNELAYNSYFPDDTKVKLTDFFADDSLLPQYVFSYYSGESPRMYEVFRPSIETYDEKLRKGLDLGPKRLFYALPIHSQFVLLAFLNQESELVQKFLEEQLGLNPTEGIESVLFIIRRPPWKSQSGDPRFWNAKGIVQEFLSRLYDIALAPIEISRTVSSSLWNKTTLQFKYLYVKDIDSLKRLVGNQTPAKFFRDLESTYVSELIEEIRIRIRIKRNNEAITFRELSEGEQQLLTVLGLLRFTSDKESLFLLDEPDTHLNPRWSVDYISYLKSFIDYKDDQSETSHIVLATHNPLAIAELEREQVQILQLKNDSDGRRIVACHPELPPRGMGYAAIVTSDMFGIASSMDLSTQLLLEEQRALAAKELLSSNEQHRLDEINATLDRLGFRFFHPDDEYSRYLRLRNALLMERFETDNPKVLAENVVQMTRTARENLAKDLIADLLKQNDEQKDGADLT